MWHIKEKRKGIERRKLKGNVMCVGDIKGREGGKEKAGSKINRHGGRRNSVGHCVKRSMAQVQKSSMGRNEEDQLCERHAWGKCREERKKMRRCSKKAECAQMHANYVHV